MSPELNHSLLKFPTPNPILLAIFTLLNFGLANSVFGQQSKARYAWMDSVRLYQKSGNEAGQVRFAENQKYKLEKKGNRAKEEMWAFCEFMVQTHLKQGQLTLAEKWLRITLEINLSKKDENPIKLISSMHSLGITLVRMGKLDEGESLVRQALDLSIKTLGPDHPEVAKGYFGLGNVLVKKGKFEEAIRAYKNSLNGVEIADSMRGIYLNGLGSLYSDLGRIAEADSCFGITMAIFQSNFKENDLHFADIHMHLGILNERIGNYDKAGAHFEKVLNIYVLHYGENHPEVADVLNNLGVIDLEVRNFKAARDRMLKALEIRQSQNAEPDLNLGIAIFNLGNIHFFLGQYAESGRRFREALVIFKKLLPPQHLEMVDFYNNLASVDFRLGRFQEAEQAYLQAIQILNTNHLHSNFKLAETYHRLAVLHLVWGKMDLAESEFRKFHEITLNTIHQYFPFFSEDEKEKYVQKITPYMDIFKSFCLLRVKENPTILDDLFNHQMETKGLIMHSSSKWRSRVQQTKDTTSLRLYADWIKKQKAIYHKISEGISTDGQQTDSLQWEAEKLEKELSRRSEDFSQLKKKDTLDWRKISKVLSRDEVVVEIIRVPKFGVEEIKTDSSNPELPRYSIYGVTDTIQYAFLLVKNGSTHPELVLLKNGNDLEGDNFKTYQKAIRRMTRDDISFNRYWKNIDEKLTGIKTVWISPDGVYHKINLNTLENPITRKYTLEEKEIRLLTNSRDLLEKGISKRNPGRAILMGAPKFDLSEFDSSKIHSQKEKKWDFVPLPSSKEELNLINQIINKAGIQSSMYSGEKATEANLKKVQNPTILHLATHGFFEADSLKARNPLFQSGMVFSNPGQTGPEGEDGILTSMEAMNLPLENTELVVLSACETGLGTIKNGEGVYGLQRALKVAGAGSIIMSLWKISDKTTQELMVSFYRHWLRPQTTKSPLNPPTRPPWRKLDLKTTNQKGSGNRTADIPPLREKLGGAKRSAFLAAQKELKAKYPSPFFWGAFVLVGD